MLVLESGITGSGVVLLGCIEKSVPFVSAVPKDRWLLIITVPVVVFPAVVANVRKVVASAEGLERRVVELDTQLLGQPIPCAELRTQDRDKWSNHYDGNWEHRICVLLVAVFAVEGIGNDPFLNALGLLFQARSVLPPLG